MQTLEERNTYTQIDAPQVHRICDLVLNKDLSQHLSAQAGRYCNQETGCGLSVRDLKTSSNSPKWTNSERKGQDLRVPVKSKSKVGYTKPRKSKVNAQTTEFKRYTKGMTCAQKVEYLLRMSETEKAKIQEKVLIEERKEKAKKEKDQKKLKESIEPKSKKEKKKKVYVYVLNMRGKSLMPTSPMKADKLLREGKAKVVERCPFKIQLNYPTGENKQRIRAGFDSGYKHLGISCVTDKAELLSADVELRTDIPDLLNEKAMYRKAKRNNNTRYREPRFDNRGGEDRREGWFAPSVQHKIDSHVRLINRAKQCLPINDEDIIIEVATFDTQKMQNPEMSGIEYQQGTLQGYEIREYLLEKWGRKCAYGHEENVPLEVEHIIPTSRGGTNRVSNLCMACHDCNQKKGNLTAAEFGHPEVQAQAKQSLKDAAFMNIVRWKLANSIPGCHTTYGYITKHNRIKLGLEKSHINDAFVIANGTNQSRCKPFSVKQIRRNNRALQLNRKGFKPSIRRQRYKYSPGDLVLFTDKDMTKKECFVKGVFNYGEWTKLENPIPGEKEISTNIKNVKIIKYGKGFRFSYSDVDLSSSQITKAAKTKETGKIEEIDEESESIDTTSQTGLFGEEVIIQSKKVEKKEKKKKEKKVYDLFGKKVKQDKSKKVTKYIESVESIDTTTQVVIDNAWNRKVKEHIDGETPP